MKVSIVDVISTHQSIATLFYEHPCGKEKFDNVDNIVYGYKSKSWIVAYFKTWLLVQCLKWAAKGLKPEGLDVGQGVPILFQRHGIEVYKIQKHYIGLWYGAPYKYQGSSADDMRMNAQKSKNNVLLYKPTSFPLDKCLKEKSR